MTLPDPPANSSPDCGEAPGYLFTGPASSVVKADGANGRLRSRASASEARLRRHRTLGRHGRRRPVRHRRDRAASGPRPGRKPAVYDLPKLFDEVGKEIDAVTVSTPDHHHALPSLLAIRSGKHVYCQKPLAQTPARPG